MRRRRRDDCMETAYLRLGFHYPVLPVESGFLLPIVVTNPGPGSPRKAAQPVLVAELTRLANELELRGQQVIERHAELLALHAALNGGSKGRDWERKANC